MQIHAHSHTHAQAPLNTYTCIQPQPHGPRSMQTHVHRWLAHSPLRAHPWGACTYLSPHSHSSQVPVPDKFMLSPSYFPSCSLGEILTVGFSLGCRGRGREEESRVGCGCAKGQLFQPRWLLKTCVNARRVQSPSTPARPCTATHLQAGHPDAHSPHEQQVVGQELLQLGEAASL